MKRISSSSTHVHDKSESVCCCSQFIVWFCCLNLVRFFCFCFFIYLFLSSFIANPGFMDETVDNDGMKLVFSVLFSILYKNLLNTKGRLLSIWKEKITWHMHSYAVCLVFSRS